jgi:hypothetical protein
LRAVERSFDDDGLRVAADCLAPAARVFEAAPLPELDREDERFAEAGRLLAADERDVAWAMAWDSLVSGLSVSAYPAFAARMRQPAATTCALVPLSGRCPTNAGTKVLRTER